MRHIVICFTLAAMCTQATVLSAQQPAAGQQDAAVTARPPATNPSPARPSQTSIAGTIQSTGQATISGTIITPAGEPLGNMRVQARNLLTGQVDGAARTTAEGEYAIKLNPGNYVLEVVDDGGQIIAVSSFISAAAASVVATTMTVASGALSAAISSATGLAATLGATAAKGVGMAAAGAGVAGVVVPAEKPIASPSR